TTDGTESAVVGGRSSVVDELCEALFLSAAAREMDDNLLFVRDRLLRNDADRASLLDLYANVYAKKPVRPDDTNPLIDTLRLSGITRVSSAECGVRNTKYREGGLRFSFPFPYSAF